MKDRKNRLWNFDSVDNAANPEKLIDYLDFWRKKRKSIQERNFNRHRRGLFLKLLGVKKGDHMLEVGCGIGQDVQILARLVGKTGKVTGIDNSKVMVREARKRVRGSNLPVEFRAGDACKLDFPDNIFSAVFCERLFQHLEKPRLALSEMIRVTRPGGKVLVIDVDVGSILLNHPDRELTRRILAAYCDSHKSGWIGRQLPGLFVELKLENIGVICDSTIQLNYDVAADPEDYFGGTELAKKLGLISAVDAKKWWKVMEKTSLAGMLAHSLTRFGVVGTKPIVMKP